MIIDMLQARIDELKCPVCAGLDPQLSFIPEFIKNEAFAEFGKTPEGAAEAIFRFNKGIIDALCGIVPVVKPQIAMYERFGPEGLRAYAETIKFAKRKGFIVIGDAKRGDIASTAEAYADAHIGCTDIDSEEYKAFDADFLTINPYLGLDSLEPFTESCRKYDKGLFVLVKTSNPGAVDIQDIDCGGEALYERVGRLVAKAGEGFTGNCGFSSIGAVVGATWPEQAARLRNMMPSTFFLIPGYGAQGGRAKDLAVCFDGNGRGGVVNSSRGIIAAWKNPENAKRSEREFAECAREAALKMKDELSKYIYG